MLEDCCAAATDELHERELEIINMIYCHVMASRGIHRPARLKESFTHRTFRRRPRRRRHRRQQGHRQGHRPRLRRGRGEGRDPVRHREEGCRHRRRARAGRHRRRRLTSPTRPPWHAAFDEVGEDLRRPRRPLLQRRHLPAGEDRGDDRRRLGRGAGHQSQGQLPVGAGVPAGAEGVGPGADRADLVDHRAGDRLSGLDALRRQQGGAARLHADGVHRAGEVRDHRQRGDAGQHPDRGAGGPRGRTTRRRWRPRCR